MVILQYQFGREKLEELIKEQFEEKSKETMYKMLLQTHTTDLMQTLDKGEVIEAVNDSLKYLQEAGDNVIAVRMVKYFVMTNSFVKHLKIKTNMADQKIDLDLIC